MLELLNKKILSAQNKLISYSTFMNMALYHPDEGYYMKTKEKIGKAGDFFTSSNIHGVYGRLFGKIFIRLVEQNIIAPYFCEIGGGTGRFAQGVLEEFKNQNFSGFTYLIVETSPYHRDVQRGNLAFDSQVLQYKSLAELKNDFPLYSGLIFSNELFDAFPVDIVTKKNGKICEVMVGINDKSQLYEQVVRCDKTPLLDWLKRNEIQLREDQRYEIPLAMESYVKEIGEWVQKSVMITIDYGYTNEEWMEPIHRDGSIRGFYNHELFKDPLMYPGQMDLTTHIHLDALIKSGEHFGLNFVNQLRQNEFLLRAGILEYLQDNFDPNPFSEISKRNRAIRSLISSSDISSAFHVTIQQKGLHSKRLNEIILHSDISKRIK